MGNLVSTIGTKDTNNRGLHDSATSRLAVRVRPDAVISWERTQSSTSLA